MRNDPPEATPKFSEILRAARAGLDKKMREKGGHVERHEERVYILDSLAELYERYERAQQK